MSSSKWFDMHGYLPKIRLWELVYRETMTAVAEIYDRDTEYRDDVGPQDPFPQGQWPIRIDTPSLTEFTVVICRPEPVGIKFDLKGHGVGSSSLNFPPAIDGRKPVWVRSHGTPATTDEELTTEAKKIVADALRVLLPLRQK